VPAAPAWTHRLTYASSLVQLLSAMIILRASLMVARMLSDSA
jgi:hypothetical protein